MYNPDYLERPYIVVLNKIDKPEVSSIVLFEGIRLHNSGIVFQQTILVFLTHIHTYM